MELVSKKLRKARRMTAKDFSLFEKWAQDQQQNTEQDNPEIVPEMLQKGQSVYDVTGQEFTVLDDSDAGQKVIMPSNQQGQQIPTGIKQMTPEELSSSYTIQPQARKVLTADSEAYELNWGDFADIVGEMRSAVDAQDMKRLMENAQDLMELIMLNVQVPADVDLHVAFNKVPKTAVHPAFRQAQFNDIPMDKVKESEVGPITLGEGGFSKCMARLKELVAGKYDLTEIMLTLGEEFDRTLATKVLNEARENGLI